MVRKVEVVPHQDSWKDDFEKEAEHLRSLLGDEAAAVHHIGSTAIPGISAKPIIDLLVVVRRIEEIDAKTLEMSQAGYIPRGEYGIPGRRYFIKGDEDLHTHHIHMFEVDHPEVDRHLRFRDYMIAHPQEAQVYSCLKEDLARRYPADIEGYMDGKDAFIKDIDRKARKSSQ